MYNKLKYIGASFWALTYMCFIMVGIKYEYALIPLIVCAYNISYELIYTTLADSNGQRLRNGIWFLLDCFVVYFHIQEINLMYWFSFCFIIFFITQIVCTFIVSKDSTKAFAWVVTCIMAIILTINYPNFYSIYVLLAMVFKTIGDFSYAVAHLWYGLPNEDKFNSFYLLIIKVSILSSIVLNLIMLNNYYNV